MVRYMEGGHIHEPQRYMHSRLSFSFRSTRSRTQTTFQKGAVNYQGVRVSAVLRALAPPPFTGLPG